jgi:hypothetical protein
MGQLRLEDLAPEDRANLPYNHPMLDEYAARQAAQFGVDPKLVLAIKNAGEKSGSKSVSSAKARGVMQTIPSTGQAMGVQDPTDPVQSITGGAKYLAQLSDQLKTKDPSVLAAAYHAGPGSKPAAGNMAGSPKTEAYVDRVTKHIMSSANAAEPQQSATTGPQLPPGLSIHDLTPDDQIAYRQAFFKANPGTDPTSGNSFGENALIGAGKFFSDTGSGIRQLVATPANAVSQMLSGRDIMTQDYEGEKERKVLDAPLMNTWGGNIGYGGAAAASLAVPGGVASKLATKTLSPIVGAVTNPTARAALSRYAPVAATGATLSALTPTTAPGERSTNAAVGAALGPVMDKGGELLGRVAKPVTTWIGDNVNAGPLLRKSFNATTSPKEQQVVARAVMNDVPVYPQQLNSPGSEIPASLAADQSSALTRAMNATHGSPSDDIHGALADSRTRLSDIYDQILGNKVIKLGASSGPAPANGIASNGPPSPNNFSQRLMDIRDNYLKSRPMSAPDSGLLNDIDSALAHSNNNGALSGRQYQNYLRDYSAAGSRARKTSIVNNTQTGSPDYEAADAYSKMIDALHDQASTAIPPWQQDLFKATNRQFRNMKTLEGLAPADLTSEFNPTSVARKLQRTPGLEFDSGDPTLQDLAQFGSTFMGMDANTSKRGLWQQGKAFAGKMAPMLAAGLGEGALISAGVNHDPNSEDGILTQSAKAAAIPLAVAGAVMAGRGSLNKRVNLDYLNQPRGALADWTRLIQPAPSMAALLRAQAPMDDVGPGEAP